jgi:biopolymer transport protein ExbD
MHFQGSHKKNDDERILPLINVVFLLLIFFMITGRFSKPEPFDVDPAQSRNETTAESSNRVILISAEGRIALNGDILDASQFKAKIATVAQSQNQNSPRMRIKADGHAPAERVIEVMGWLRDAGFKKLTLLTLPVQP